MTAYRSFLEAKIATSQASGFDVDPATIHPYLKPHAKALTLWALRGGRRAIFANFGLAKTSMQLEWARQIALREDGPTLSVLPLGVRHGFINEAANLELDIRFIRSASEMAAGCQHYIANYETVRDGKLDPNIFVATSLDEASVLRSYGSKTYQEFLPLFDRVPFKLVATATPSPNRTKELIHYAGFLGIMDTGQALTRFFQRNSEKAGDLQLYPHKVEEFWLWVHTWAIFLQTPSDLGFSDEGYALPPLEVIWHEVPADHSKAAVDRDGQGALFRNAAAGVTQAAAAKRDSLPSRVEKMLEIVDRAPERHRIIWHDLEAEREAIEAALPGVVTITGSMDLDEREKRLVDFEEGRIRTFGTKPILSGSGSNFQYHCHEAVYLGIGFKFNDFIQSIFRLQRYGQERPVTIHLIYSEEEREVRANLEEKWNADREMRLRMAGIIRRYGLDSLPLDDVLGRSIGRTRREVRGADFVAVNADCVEETGSMAEASTDLIVTSIPFSNHYEYSASYNDFGHTDNNDHFWRQMDFLTPQLLRVLKPGRLACIHVKDRILFGSVTGTGVPTVSPFHAEGTFHYRRHGFDYMGMITVVTDVVRENNATYRLGWTENSKDSTKMGVGSPEYILLFRKPQSDRSRGYADLPVEKPKEAYTRARWQIDAHSFWRSSGERLLTGAELSSLSQSALMALWEKRSLGAVYDYEAHVALGEQLEDRGALSKTFMTLAPPSAAADVWHDVTRMQTLNSLQTSGGREKHVCPLQFDIVDRLIERYSNPGETVLDPFAGLMTVPYRAILKRRRGYGIELHDLYWQDGVRYCRAAEEKRAIPSLFDALASEDAA